MLSRSEQQIDALAPVNMPVLAVFQPLNKYLNVPFKHFLFKVNIRHCCCNSILLTFSLPVCINQLHSNVIFVRVSGNMIFAVSLYCGWCFC